MILFLIAFSVPETSDDHTQYTGCDDQDGRRNGDRKDARKGCQQKDTDIQTETDFIYDGFIPKSQDCLDDEYADTDADACEGILDDGQISKALQEGGDDQDNDDGHGDKA